MNVFVMLIGALAWPSAALAIAFLLRRELRLALGRLGQVKYGAMEINFPEDLRQAEILAHNTTRTKSPILTSPTSKIRLEAALGGASEIPGTLVGGEVATSTSVLIAAGSKSASKRPRDRDSYLGVCRTSPRLGILESWDELKNALVHSAASLGDRRSPIPVRDEAAVQFLVDRGWLHHAEGELIERLRRLGELIEHRQGPPATEEDARRFVDLVIPLVERVEGLI